MPSLILPELAGGNVLKMDYEVPARGNIYDRTGEPVAIQTDAYALGIQPGDLTGKSEFSLVAQLSQLCGRTPECDPGRLRGRSPDWYVGICEASSDEAQGVS